MLTLSRAADDLGGKPGTQELVQKVESVRWDTCPMQHEQRVTALPKEAPENRFISQSSTLHPTHPYTTFEYEWELYWLAVTSLRPHSDQLEKKHHPRFSWLKERREFTSVHITHFSTWGKTTSCSTLNRSAEQWKGIENACWYTSKTSWFHF